MTRESALRLAKGMPVIWDQVDRLADLLMAVARQSEEMEREACARLSESYRGRPGYEVEDPDEGLVQSGMNAAAEAIADMIRERVSS